ncbi:trypsin-like serine protease [Candidatus Sororendozoicomonas aggregata]|uniref:trypsin-like serine protease n=1 Tax=Candidatus Sororendozoicomonas aggregata TaxID=3073239 RepID=UPI002ED3ED63
MSKYITLVTSLCMSLIASAGYPSTTKSLNDNTSPFDVFIDSGNIVKDTSQAPYSSVVKITYNGQLCTGTLIRYNEVLTSGDCVQDESGKKIAPAMYTITSSDGETSWHVKEIKTAYSHDPASDFALLKTDNTNKNTPSVPLASKEITQQWLLTNYPSLLTVGYGIDLARPDKNYKADLQQGVVKPTSQLNAQHTVRDGLAWFKSKGFIVTGTYGDGKGMFSTCSNQAINYGDTGGPVFYKNPRDNTYYLIGTTGAGLTFPNPDAKGEYLSYNRCIDHENVDQEGQKLSIFTDLTHGSANYYKLKDLEGQI